MLMPRGGKFYAKSSDSAAIDAPDPGGDPLPAAAAGVEAFSAGGTVRTGKTVSDPRREAVPIQGLEFYLTFSAVRYTIIL